MRKTRRRASRVLTALLVSALFLSDVSLQHALACCPAPPSGKPVVNADQSVIILWDEATHTEHFIRRASFKSEADDFGFLVPTPSQPELSESGNSAFGFFESLTEPIRLPVSRSISKGELSLGTPASLRVLEQKLVAGFDAAVLETNSTDALVSWLKANGYSFSPAIKAWAEPYVNAGWKLTAFKVAKNSDERKSETVEATALRMSFKTERPLFPYREPDSAKSAEALKINKRLLRIYFVSDAQYQGKLQRRGGWTGKTVWSGKLNAVNRNRALELLKLPKEAGPTDWWLTEFEDPWPYEVAASDLYFSKNPKQETIQRPPI